MSEIENCNNCISKAYCFERRDGTCTEYQRFPEKIVGKEMTENDWKNLDRLSLQKKRGELSNIGLERYNYGEAE